MIKVETKDGSVAFQSNGNLLDLAQEVLTIRQFLEQHQEIGRMADLIEKISRIETERCSNPEELKKAQDEFTNSEHERTTEEMLKSLFGKKMN